MAVITPPFVQQGGSHPAATFRQMLMGSTGSPTGSFAGGVQPTTGGGGHGIWSTTDLVATQNGTPNMSVNVAAGGCFVRGTEAAAQGVYAAFNDATLNVVIAASDPTNPRRDLLVMRVRDAFYSGASTDVALAIVTGTPAGVPVDPAVPVNCLVLARIAVGAAVTTILNANITSLTPRASSLGAMLTCTSTTRPTGAALYTGLVIYETDTTRQWMYVGATWVLLYWYTAAGRPGVILTDTAQSVTNATVSDLTWSTEVSDVDAWTSGASATLTVPAGWAGRYAVTFSGVWSSSPGTSNGVQCLINGSAVQAYNAQALWTPITLSFVQSFAAGDTIKFQVYQSSGAAINIVSRLEVVWLGP